MYRNLIYDKDFMEAYKLGYRAPISPTFGQSMGYGEDDSTQNLRRSIGNYQTRLGAVGQPMPAPKPKTNWLLNALGYLDKPRNALFNAVHSAVTDQDTFLTGLKKGWTGEEKYHGSDLLGDLGIENRFVKGAGGFLIDMVGDPLNYASAGLGSAAKGFFTGAGGTMAQESAEQLSKVALRGATREAAEAAMRGVTKESAEKAIGSAAKRAGMEFTEQQTARLAKKLATKRAEKALGGALGKVAGTAVDDMGRAVGASIDDIYNAATREFVTRKGSDVLSKVGQKLTPEAIKAAPSMDDIFRQMSDAYANRLMDTSNVLAKRGMGIGTRESFKGLTDKQMRDAGAKASKWVQENTGVVGKAFESIQDSARAVFNPAYVKGLDAESTKVLRGIVRDAKGGRLANDQALLNKATELANKLKSQGLDKGKEYDKLVTELVESSLKLSDEKALPDAVKQVVQSMKDDFKAWGLKEQEIEMLGDYLMDDYFPHVKSLKLLKEESKMIQKGAINEKMRVFNPSKWDRSIRENVGNANLVILERTSSPEAREAFVKALINTMDGRTEAIIGSLIDAGNDPAQIDKALEAVKSFIGEKAYDGFISRVPDGGDFIAELASMMDTTKKGLNGLLKEASTNNNKRASVLKAIRGYLGESAYEQVARASLDGVQDYFETSALNAYITRGLRHNQVIANKEMVDSIISAFGERINPQMIDEIIQSGQDVVVSKSAMSVFGLNVKEYVATNKVAKDTVELLKERGKDIKGWDEFVNAYDDLIAQATKDGELAKAVEYGMERARAADMLENLRSGITDGTLSKMTPEVANVIRKISDTSTGTLLSLDGKEYAAFARYFPIEAYSMPPGVIEFVNKTTKNQNEAGMQTLMKVFDKFNQIWKPTVTGLRPDYYLRNFAGSAQQNMLDIGMKIFDPDLNKQARQVMSGAGEVTVAGQKIPVSEIMHGMEKYHALSTMVRSDIETLSDNIAKITGGITNLGDAPAEGVLRKIKGATSGINDAIERGARIPNFLANMEFAIERGRSLEEAMAFAGEMVQKFHFDYSDLSNVERDVIRKIVPFYTFARKNLPLQLEAMLNKPSTFTNINKWNANMASAYGTDMSDMPGYMAEQMPIAMPFLDRGNDKTTLANLSLPMADISRASSPGGFVKDSLLMMSPMLRYAIEATSNRKMVSGAPIYRNDHEKNQQLLKYALEQFGVARDVTRGLQAPEDTEGKALTSTFSNIPALNMTTRLLQDYSPEGGARDAMYDYTRQLGNEVQWLKGQGVPVPDMDMAELLPYMPKEAIEMYTRSGQLPQFVIDEAREKRNRRADIRRRLTQGLSPLPTPRTTSPATAFNNNVAQARQRMYGQ